MIVPGTYTALLTPFSENGGVDWLALQHMVERQVEARVEGLVPCGTTGESPTLDHDEHRKVIAKTVEWAKKKNPHCIVMAGTGSNSTREAIELTKAAAQDGADYALVVSPYYNKPTQAGLLEHFTLLADVSPIPLVLYNIPGRTSVSLSLETIIRLAEHKNIQAIKEASGDLGLAAKIVIHAPKDFLLFSGDDNLLLPVLSVGGKGCVSVVSNLFPFSAGEITRLFCDGKMEEAQKIFNQLFPLSSAMSLETNPIPAKYAASKLGLCKNILRLPMTPLNQEKTNTVDELLQILKNVS